VRDARRSKNRYNSLSGVKPPTPPADEAILDINDALSWLLDRIRVDEGGELVHLTKPPKSKQRALEGVLKQI
jgi:hypothetical protein